MVLCTYIWVMGLSELWHNIFLLGRVSYFIHIVFGRNCAIRYLPTLPNAEIRCPERMTEEINVPRINSYQEMSRPHAATINYVIDIRDRP